jgi:hypothetical protein
MAPRTRLPATLDPTISETDLSRGFALVPLSSVGAGFNITDPVKSSNSSHGRTIPQWIADAGLNTKGFGEIGDGTLHPLSSAYSTLAKAQAVYPFVTSLTQQIDWAAAQLALNTAVTAKFSPVIFPWRRCVLQRPVKCAGYYARCGDAESGASDYRAWSPTYSHH